MKKTAASLSLLIGWVGITLTGAQTDTTIDTTNRFAYGENIGWPDWRYDTGAPGRGATIGQYFCSGFIYGENVGWVQLGTGAPADGINYTNTDAADSASTTTGEARSRVWRGGRTSVGSPSMGAAQTRPASI